MPYAVLDCCASYILLAVELIQIATNDPLSQLQRKESNISFPEANVQTLGLGL